MIDKLRDHKTLEIRKAVWNNKGAVSKRKRAKVSNKESSTNQTEVVDDSLCPICHIKYVDLTAWVWCDNSDCGTYVCRKCAKLENDDDYQSAMNRHWDCSLCQ